MIQSIKRLLPQSFRDRHRKRWIGTTLFTKIYLGKIVRLFCRPPFPKLNNDLIYLNLGCGPVNNPNFINIDAFPQPHVHYVREVDRLPIFKDNSVDLIYASHCLEHFSRNLTQQILAEWYRILKKGGVLRLSVPDFDKLVYICKENNNDPDEIMCELMGGQYNKYDCHFVVFNKVNLEKALNKVGFLDIREWFHCNDELSICDTSTKKKIVNNISYDFNLNIEAKK